MSDNQEEYNRGYKDGAEAERATQKAIADFERKQWLMKAAIECVATHPGVSSSDACTRAIILIEEIERRDWNTWSKNG